MDDALLPTLPKDRIIQALNKAPGNEIASGKLGNPASSAALAVNTFGLFLDRPADLPTLPGTEGYGWPAREVAIEKCVRFPWRGGQHPWLDAFVETATHIIGIESKRYEPFRGPSSKTFSEVYWRPVWGSLMRPCEAMRDALGDQAIAFQHLDAAQLVKHAFGLRTEAQRVNKVPVLVYLYAEPKAWPDGKIVTRDEIERHRHEAARFADLVGGAEVAFKRLSYQRLLAALAASMSPAIRRHAETVAHRFQPF